MAVIILVLLADIIFNEPKRRILQGITCVLLLAQIIVNFIPSDTYAFGGMYHSDLMSSVFKSILTIGTLLVFMQSDQWLAREDTHHKAGEFYIITLCTLLGMYFMTSAGSFLLFYIGLELASIPMACLVAMDKSRRESAEAGAKFILSSMFSSGIMLYGLSLIYGACGTTYFDDLIVGASESPLLSGLVAPLTGTPLQIMAMVFFFAGFGFKLSLVPFHMWAPDTYQGAPTPVTGYLSVISKGAAAYALMTILVKVFGGMMAEWSLLISIVTVLSITIANLFAIKQKNLKRFMAYSSISQAGYIMLAVLGGDAQGFTSLAFYITVYIFANLAVFGVIGTIEQHSGKLGTAETSSAAGTSAGESATSSGASDYTGGLSANNGSNRLIGGLSISDYNGLYKTNPRLCFVMTIALFSLAGIPPFAGFFSKFFVFASAFHSGHWLVVFIALLNTIISLYYYLLIIRAMYITPNDSPIPAFRTSWSTRTSLVICLLGVMLLGVISGVYQLLANYAV